MKRIAVLFVVSIVVLMAGVNADGKGHGGNQHKKKEGKIQDVTLDGVVESVDGGEMKILATKSGRGKKKEASKTEWLVAPQQGLNVHVLGSATVDYLRSGTVVQFSATLGSDGKPVDKITRMSVIAPSKDHPLGVFDGSGIQPSDPGVGGDGVNSAPKKQDDDADRLLMGAAGQSRIVGKITSCTADTMIVSAGAKSIKCELSTVPTIDVALSDPTLIQPGDKVIVRGKGRRGKVNQCMASNVTVTLTQPLTGRKKLPSKHDAPQSASASATPDDSSKDSDAKADENDKHSDAKGDEKGSGVPAGQ
jgi:hypothetical protein